MANDIKRIFHDVEQGSEEWFNCRLGVITSSNFGTIMAHSIARDGTFNPNAKFGDPAKKYAMQVALEGITKRHVTDFQNEWMQRGLELEGIARQKYELLMPGVLVDNGGFTKYGRLGTSPDGRVYGTDKNTDTKYGVEIKSVKYNTHFACLESGDYDKKYKWQLQGQIWVDGFTHTDFISFCPDFPEDKELLVVRVMPNEDMINKLQKRLNVFIALVDEYKKLL